MKKRILIAIICITVISIIIVGIFKIVLPIVSLLGGNSIEITLPARNESAPENIDTTNEISVAKLRANCGFLIEGYCETQADTLREKILNSPNTEKHYKITGNKYYISSSDGNDSNDGRSPEKAIKSLERLEELYIIEGDAVLFKRGDTFRFGESLSTNNGVTYGCYGNGVKPKLYGSPENYAKSDKWEKANDHIWKIPFDYPEACGLVLNHSQLVGVKKKEFSKLNNNGDYLHDTKKGIFYLYCDKGTPTDVYYDIEIMPSINIISAMDCGQNITIDNLCIKYSAGFGIHTVNAADFTVTNCEFGFLGGKFTSDNNLRYGNAVEFWNGGINIKVENNWFYQTFDSALTWQGDNDNDYLDISFSGNLFEYNNADIEFFCRGESALENFRVENNIMRFTSMGWGTRKNDGGIRGIEGCIRGVTGSHPKNEPIEVKSVYFKNNTLDCPARQTINWNMEPDQREFIHATGTKLYIKSDYRTLRYYLQGHQTSNWQPYNYIFATDIEDLKEGFELFEKNAQIYYDGK